MKKIFYTIMAVSAAFSIVSCSENQGISDFLSEGEPCELNVSIVTPDAGTLWTKAVKDSTNDAKINNIQIFVFRRDGVLDGYQYSTTNNLKVLCTAGSGRQIYAVVNGQDLSSVATKEQLLKTETLFANNKLSSFEMVGNTDTLTISSSNTSIPVSVSRIASRIEVCGITNDLKMPQLKDVPIKIDTMFLANVASNTSFDFTTVPDESKFINQMKYTASSVDSLVFEKFTDFSVAQGTPDQSVHYFYAYPNSCEETTTGAPWSRRCTRLVLAVTIGSDKYYYPINLPALEHNKSYKISNITITKPGSDNPDEPVTGLDCTFTVTVNSWTSVDVTGGTTI